MGLRWDLLRARLRRRLIDNYWMRIEVLRQYSPRPVRWDRIPAITLAPGGLPRIGIVTPSYQQAGYLAATLASVLDQEYPRLVYAVQDGGSRDGSAALIQAQAGRLAAWACEPDRGQADAIGRGFARIADRLGPDDVMAWINSDDLFAPGTLRFVGEYFARHPDVDAIYGHRLIIDEQGREIGRWVMPRHDPRVLEWVDYVPQETLFWRKRAWDRVGGLDASFQFALDWDLLARFTSARLKLVRVPRFLGAFRVHPEQKTSRQIHSTGAEEMTRIRERFHGPDRHSDWTAINRWADRVRFWGAVTSRLRDLGISV